MVFILFCFCAFLNLAIMSGTSLSLRPAFRAASLNGAVISRKLSVGFPHNNGVAFREEHHLFAFPKAQALAHL